MSPPKFTLLDDPFSVLSGQPQASSSAKTANPANPNAGFFNNSVDSVREAISELYEGFLMTKTQSQGPYGVYKAYVNSLTSGDAKYICCIVPNDTVNPLGTMQPLSKCKWINFQARTTTNPRVEFAGFPLKPQEYVPKRNTLLWDKIKVANETESQVVYVPDHLPLVVTIFILKESDNFAPEGTVISSLELFQTMIQLETGHA